MDKKFQAGLNKKSFELNFNGGSLWAEHLDSMGGYETKVINKFLSDYKTFCRNHNNYILFYKKEYEYIHLSYYYLLLKLIFDIINYNIIFKIFLLFYY